MVVDFAGLNIYIKVDYLGIVQALCEVVGVPELSDFS